MIGIGIITENRLDEWVRGNERDAQGVTVELVYRLVAASSPRPKDRRFPLGDSIEQPGPDGFLDVEFPYGLFVPNGRSFWQIGASLNAGAKATSDYRDLVAAIPEAIRFESTFVFVTPLSGRRNWPHTWKEKSQGRWLAERRGRNEWRDVRVIDGTRLIDWLHDFPSVDLWLAQRIGVPVAQIETPEMRWSVLRTIGEPPLLPAQLFLTNRDAACARLQEIFAGTTVQLKLTTRFPDQVADFVCAYVAAMDDSSRIDAVGRCLIVSGADAWNVMVAQRERHILIADFDLDDTEAAGTKLLEKARRAGHAVVFSGMPGGIPHPNSESIPNPKSHQVQELLENAGYTAERARILAQKSNGNLTSLLRCLQNASLMPEWAQGTPAADLAVAEFLGGWNEGFEADRAVVECLSGKSYGEWVGTIREAALRPGTPLTLRDGVWKFVARYEGWYSLGPRIFDEHLDRLQEATVAVLSEPDPQFELPPGERYAAGIYGKVLIHSPSLRRGLAETLALLGSHPEALASCSVGKANATAVLSVRDILTSVDWVRWASLTDLLPLLAEAAPGAFLDAVESALTSDPCPFDELFAQEGRGTIRATYLSGLLWALETLAWDSACLSRVVTLLGELAARDPGGTYSNRPANSLTAILLPWLPQTCAPVAKRTAAVTALSNELPHVAWKLLLSLLPQSHRFSTGSRRPAWRDTIPADWPERPITSEYWEQIDLYAEMTVGAAEGDPAKLAELIDRWERLPPFAHEQLLAHLASDAVTSLPEADRLRVWTALVDLVAKHRKFADAGWAMPTEQVDRIAVVTERLAPVAPAFRNQRLFSERDWDLYEERADFKDQQRKLEERRQRAVEEVAASGGVQSVIAFAQSVESPWVVGIAYGLIAGNDDDRAILPALLETEQKALAQFAGGYVWGRFRNRGWAWVDEIDASLWAPTEVAQFLAYLPFTSDTWARAERLLGENESMYWTRANVNPYQSKAGLELAVDRLIEYGRPFEAIGCLAKMQHDGQPLDGALAVRALLAAARAPEDARSMDAYKAVELIKALQAAPDTAPDDLFRVEWAYLPILDEHYQASPKLLERRLADDPAFFSELIRLVFRSRKEPRIDEERTEEAKDIATSAYDLLSEWRTPPGLRQDGSFDGDALTAWLEAVKSECGQSGHLEVAMTMVGHVLVYTPADPGGLWIHRSAAAALNAKDAGDMRDGFRIQLYNLRGVHWVDPTGKPETELAEKYRRQADEVENAGHQRLAAAMRELADSYDREAARIILEHKEGPDDFH